MTEDTTAQAEKHVVMKATTPSGIAIEYEATPRRLYRVNGEEVPSVTKTFDILHKEGLLHWYQEGGVEGVLLLWDKGALVPYTEKDGTVKLLVGDDSYEPPWTYATPQNVVAALKEHGLTAHDKRDKAGDRGVTVHNAFEAWVKDGTLPVPELYEENQKGYVQGLLAFINDVGEIKNQVSELMVASAEYGYAGRLDSLFEIGYCSLVSKPESPKGRRKEIRWEPDPGLWMWDLKTSKDFYTTQFIQLEAYEEARLESGYVPPVIGKAVIKVGADGKYAVRPSKVRFDHFLAILGLYEALKNAEEEMK